MINTFARFVKNIKGDFFWRLKYLLLRASRNPEYEIAFTAKHKRILPFSVLTGREHAHETFIFLAVFSFLKSISHFLWVRGFMCHSKNPKIAISRLSDFYYTFKYKY